MPARSCTPAARATIRWPPTCASICATRSTSIRAEIGRLQQALLDLAEREAETILPGFTHLQTAQPVTFGHHLMAWFEMLERDRERLRRLPQAASTSCPWGPRPWPAPPIPSTATTPRSCWASTRPARTPWTRSPTGTSPSSSPPLPRILMMHLSRFSEELVLWSSAQFGFVELSDSFCTGSSIMPQKKNPDVPELVRGKSGRIFGHLMALLTLMKGQPLAYNKDNQEDKEPLFDTVDNLKGCAQGLRRHDAGAMRCNRDAMRAAALKGFATATDLADYLVRKGTPFRDAHEVVGKAVAHGMRGGQGPLASCPWSSCSGSPADIDDDVFEVLTLEGSVAARDHIGGTAPKQVRAAIARARERLAEA